MGMKERMAENIEDSETKLKFRFHYFLSEKLLTELFFPGLRADFPIMVTLVSKTTKSSYNK